MKMYRIIFLGLMMLPLLATAQKLELGMPYGHTDVVYNLLFSEDSQLLLSGGEDGSLKLWDVKTGKLLKTSPKLNVAVLPGMSASADMRYVLYSRGWTDGRSWVFDFKNPENRGVPVEEYNGPPLLVTSDNYLEAVSSEDMEVPDGHELVDITPDGKYWLLTNYKGNFKLYDPTEKDTVLIYNFLVELPEEQLSTDTPGMEISPDGEILARSLSDGTIYLHELKTGKLIHTLQSHISSPMLLKFGADNSTLLCGSQEGRAWSWDFKAGRISASVGSQARQSLSSVNAMVPINDHELLVCLENGNLEHYDLSTGQTKILQTPTSSSYSYLSLIGYIPDQQLAYFSGEDENYEPFLRAYDIGHSPPLIDHLPPVGMWKISMDGKLGVSVDLMETDDWQQQLQLWKMPGMEPLRELEPASDNYRQISDFIISADQRKLLMLTYFELKEGTTSYVWDIPSGRLEHSLYDPEDSYATCGSLSPDGKMLLLGNWNHSVHWYDLTTGSLLHSFKGHTGKIKAVAFSPDGKKIASGADDGTVKIWDLATKKELATLVNVDERDWIVLGPDGLFDASQNAMNLLYYTIETGGKQEVIEFEQLKARFYEPGLLQKLLGYSDERIRPIEALSAVKLYPDVDASIVENSLHIELHARNGGVGKVSIFINGKEVIEEANPLPRRENAKRDHIIRYDLNRHQNFFLRHPDSTNTVSIRAYNEEGWLKSQPINLEYRPSAARSRGGSNASGDSNWIGQLDPKLYVVSIGTSNYTGTQMDLQYADQDATMMAKALQSVGTALFTNGDSLEVHCLSTASTDSTGLEGTSIQWQFADKNNIEATFETIKHRAKAEDVIVVYLSGHGVTRGGTDQTQFYYLTQGIANEDDLIDPATRRTYTISSDELTKWIKDIPALKQVLIIDACNSGQIVENLTGGSKTLNSSQIRALDRMKDRTGMFVLSGSASNKVSYEAGEYGQGLLTYALLQGMLVASQKTEDAKYIDVMKLFQYARDEVPRLAASINGIQTPMLGFPNQGASFDIGILNDNTDIPIGSKKPVVIRSNLLNSVTLIDDLQLVERLEVAFMEETTKGKDADFIYVDVSDYPIGYALSGIYEEKEGQISLKVNLVQNGKPIASLAVEEDSDPDRLTKRILRALKKQLRIGNE